ncbi:serine hydrolase domain-containing protein [Luteibacter pinisoli]|nr:serine hydrolase domain-containing protein [Luteibacter pinisoli]
MLRPMLLAATMITAFPALAADDPVPGLMKAADVPGLAIAVIRNGKVTSVKAYGYRDTEKKLPLTTDTVMYAASLTKAAFAYAVMGLVDDKRLALDASIANDLPKPLPEYPKYSDLAGDERWKKLTPALLLSHRSGFPNFRFWPPGKDYDADAKLAFYQEPGATYGYSGEGINLLQFVIENGKGVDVDTLMQQRLFKPFGMTRTGMTWRDDFADNNTVGYGPDGKAIPHKRRETARAAGSMDTTIHDYANLLAAMVRGEGLSRTAYATWLKPVVRIRSVQQFPTMGTPDSTDNDSISLGYAMGVGTFNSPRGPAFFKGGHDDGTNNVFVCLEKSRDCVLIMSNSSHAESIFPALIANTLGKTCFPWYWEGYVPYDQPGMKNQPVVPNAHPACPRGDG